MNLDRNTYEAWLLDHLEGRLTAPQEAELRAFLLAHPDLPGLPDALPDLEPTDLPFPHKELLKRSFPPTGPLVPARLDDFLIARAEGDLDAASTQALDAYLQAHPGSERDARLIHRSKVPASVVSFTAKDTIGRHFPPQGLPDAHRLDDFLVAALEGDLDAAQLAALDAHLQQHPEARRARQLIAATRTDRQAVIYPHKAELRRTSGRVVPLWGRLAMAASVAALLGFLWWLNGPEPPPSVAQVPVPTPTAPVPVPAPVPAPTIDAEVAPGPSTAVQRPADPVPHERSSRSPSAPQPQQQGPAPGTAPSGTPNNAPDLSPETLPEPAPLLAEAPAAAPDPASTLAAGGERHETLATLVANTVREGMLETPTRPANWDRNDAVALVDKGLQAVSSGQAGMQVQRTSARDRMQLRLGRHFSISASRGR